jgi:hypothetical protein
MPDPEPDPEPRSLKFVPSFVNCHFPVVTLNLTLGFVEPRPLSATMVLSVAAPWPRFIVFSGILRGTSARAGPAASRAIRKAERRRFMGIRPP